MTEPTRDERPDGDRAEGWFDYEGWLLHGATTESRAGQFASAHEAHHKQLADSTTWGALTRTLRRLPGDGPAHAIAFNGAASPVQEAFASRAPAAAIGWTIDDLTAAYPAYRRHWQAMERAVTSVPSAYMHSHAGHAVARASMQTPNRPRSGVGLERCSIADVPRRLRPDHRFAILQRHPVDWRAVYESLDADLAGDPRWATVRDGDRLRTAMFAVELRSLWMAVNDAAFAACAARLAEHGCPTLGSAAHHEEIVGLLDAARLIVPEP